MATDAFFAHLRSLNDNMDFCNVHQETYENVTGCNLCASDLDANVPHAEDLHADTSFADLDNFDEPIVLAEPEPEVPETVESVASRLNLYFPFATIRPTQGTILHAVAQARVNEKKFTLIDAPTGVGKSPVGIAVALHSAEHPTKDPIEYQPGAYILTSQKALSAQMVNDFGSEGLVELRGKANYTCDRHLKNCELGSLANLGHKTCETCPYKTAKNKFIGSPMGITNYAYFIKETSGANSQLPLREHLILDEAHNVEREILSVASTTVGSLHEHLLRDFEAVPRFQAGQEVKVRDWLNATILPEQEKYIFGIKKALFKAEDDRDQQRAGVLKRDLSEAERYQESLLRFTLAENLRDWITWTDTGVLNIRPLSPARYAQEMLFNKAKHILLMSATILDFKTFRQTLGIKPSQAVSYQAPSEFPVENRRIIFWPAGSMSFKNIQETTPRLHSRCALLLKKNFAGMKGIIHTHNYKINDALVGFLRGSGFGDRVITHGRTPESRELALLQHLTSPLDTVLISPSMTEGVDLKYDLSRFQIISKVPFPYLDPYNKARLERDPGWYSLQAAVTLVQASGRSIRAADDHALTVILDSDFSRLLNDARDILPDWWKRAIEVK